ncbi:MAG: hypothetical protein M3N21_08665 [Actinomycetota bacterium]|nr:hypothetical protein [Actinomycetota bacterium]
MTARVDCSRCAISYAPVLTGGECPVCGCRAPGHVLGPRRWADLDERLLLLTLAATIANALLLGGLVAVALH